MRLHTQTAQRKNFERVQKLGLWHKKFILFPREHKQANGRIELIFFEFVYRKAVWCVMYNHETYGTLLGPDKWLYCTKPNAVYETLVDGDELLFADVDAESLYNSIKVQCQ